MIELSIRDKVNLLEAEMKKREQIDLPVKHHFSHGVYARELFIRAGTLLTGKIHKYEQLNIMSQGELLVLVGEDVKHIKAPFTIVSPPGTKRIAYALTDTVWTTIHGTAETDVDKIEAHFTADSEEDYLAAVAVKELAAWPG